VPITIVRDLQRGWLVVTATGALTIDEVVELLRTARAPVELRMWPMLFDASSATTAMSDADVDTAVAVVATAIKTGPRGHAALVAGDNRLYAWLLMYEVKCAALGVRFIRVFRQRPDAEQWLQVMSAARNLL
jgi:hypothetical protein